MKKISEMTADEKMEFILEQQAKLAQEQTKLTQQQTDNGQLINALGVRVQLVADKVDKFVEEGRKNRQEIALIWEYLSIQQKSTDEKFERIQELLYKMVLNLSATRRDQTKIIEDLSLKDILDRFREGE